MKRIFVFLAVAVLGVLASGTLRAQINPSLVGTWKMNPAKSKYSPGPGPQSQTVTFEAQGNGAKVSVQGTAADGSRIAYSYMTNYDGKDSPISGTGVAGGADTNSTKRIDANTTESTRKKAGKVIATLRNVVSKDGKVLTITVKGTDANGQPLNNVLVNEKQ
jgi:hypothetical protein